MGEFLESEKLHQARFKAISPYFYDLAHADGVYKGKLRPFCGSGLHRTDRRGIMAVSRYTCRQRRSMQ